MAHLLLIFISLLAISILSEAKNGVKHYTHKFDLVYTDTPLKISLNCSETVMEGALIYWKKEGRPELARTGPQLEITIWGPPDAGIFTCWSGNKLLSRHTVLLMKKTSTGKIYEPMLTGFEELNGAYIKCMANSYSGNFTCSWKLARYDSHLKFKIRTGNGNHTSQIIICDEPMRNSVGENSEIYTVSCRKENSCPSAEEYEPITMILEVVQHLVNVYEDHSHTFFIKDIIKPDASECQIAKHDHSVKLTWTPPKTWSTPESYFRLTYQIETVRYTHSGRKISSVCEIDDTTLLKNGSTLNCYVQLNRDERFRIRSRDHYNKIAAWSSWSEPCRGDSQRNDKPHSLEQEIKTKVEPCKCQRN